MAYTPPPHIRNSPFLLSCFAEAWDLARSDAERHRMIVAAEFREAQLDPAYMMSEQVDYP